MECLGVRSLQVVLGCCIGKPLVTRACVSRCDQHAVGVSCHLLSSGAMQLQWGARLVGMHACSDLLLVSCTVRQHMRQCGSCRFCAE